MIFREILKWTFWMLIYNNNITASDFWICGLWISDISKRIKMLNAFSSSVENEFQAYGLVLFSWPKVVLIIYLNTRFRIRNFICTIKLMFKYWALSMEWIFVLEGLTNDYQLKQNSIRANWIQNLNKKGSCNSWDIEWKK